MFEVANGLKGWLAAPFRLIVARIRGDEGRRQALLIEIVDSMATAMALSDRIGHGYPTDARFRAEMRQAVETAGGRAAVLGDPDIEDGVNEFREAAGYLLDRSNRSDWQDRLTMLGRTHNLALAVIRKKQGNR